MYCQRCGMRVSDNASFCGGCGSPVELPAQEAASPAGAGFPNGQRHQGQQPVGAPPSRGKRTAVVALVVVVALALVAAGVAAYAFANRLGPFAAGSAVGTDDRGESGGVQKGGAPDLNALVSEDPARVYTRIEGMSEGESVQGGICYSPDDETRDLALRVSDAISGGEEGMDDFEGDVRIQSPWTIALYDGRRAPLDAVDIRDGRDPAMVGYVSYRVLESPTSEDIAEIVGDVCEFNRIIVYKDVDTFYGIGRSDDCVMELVSRKHGGVYAIAVSCYSLGESDDADAAEKRFYDSYNSYEDGDYDDCYRK